MKYNEMFRYVCVFLLGMLFNSICNSNIIEGNGNLLNNNPSLDDVISQLRTNINRSITNVQTHSPEDPLRLGEILTEACLMTKTQKALESDSNARPQQHLTECLDWICKASIGVKDSDACKNVSPKNT